MIFNSGSLLEKVSMAEVQIGPVMKLPSFFPKEVAPRALAVYSFLRSFSRMLHLSPFKVLYSLEPCTFLAQLKVPPRSTSINFDSQTTGFLLALGLKIPSVLLDECHFALLRILEPVSFF